MQLVNYRRIGADIKATELTVKNVADVQAAMDEDGQESNTFISPRDQSPYILVETEHGTRRLNLGDMAVRYEDGSWDALSAEDFSAQYARP